jgi:microcystin-dependent protein
MSNNSFKVKNGLTLTPVDLTTLTTPQAGDLACDINDNNKIKRYDAASASWVEVGSGGVGSLDILFAQDFESASLSSFTQTGLALDTVDPLHGKVSAKLTHQAAINQSFMQVVAVDRKFRGQAIVMRLNVKSSASAGNVTISVYDETNAASLLSSTQLQLSNDVDGISNAVSFTIPSTSSSISYTITALPEAGSPVTFIDDIVAELSNVALLETSVEVPVMTSWQGYTPTFQGIGTPTNIEFEWRQVGQNIEVRGKFVAGTPTAVEARIGLPSGLTSAGTDIIPSIQIAGSVAYSNTGNFQHSILIEPNVSYFTVGVQDSTRAGLTKQTGPNSFASGATFSFFASAPCAGLSATSTNTIPLTQSGLVQEGDSYITLSGASGYGTSATTIRRFSTVTSSGGTDIQYEDSPTLGGRFIAQESGIYHVTYSEENTASVIQASSILYVNGVKVSVNQSDYGGATSATKRNSVSWSGYLEQGDIVTAGANVAAENNGTFVYFSMVKQGSLKQVSVSSDQKITIPTSELRFEGASARGTGTETAIVQFTSIAKLRGDAFEISNSNGTAITMKKAGKLDVSAIITNNNVGANLGISLNQAVRTSSPTNASEYISEERIAASAGVVSVSGSIFVNVGDIIRVYSSLGITSSVANNLNLSFQEQDISVSVTNTLPQFSDSDSFVRTTTNAVVFGSSATTTVRFSSQSHNIGSDISYVDSPTLGGQFTVRTAGIYNISCSVNISGSSTSSGSIYIKVNGNDVAYDGNYSATGFGNNLASTSVSYYLDAGDIVTFACPTTGTTLGLPAIASISKVGKPNVTGVDVTPFVNLQFDTGSIGEIKAFAGNVDSNHFLAADGSAVSRSRYAELFQKIGTTYGVGDGSTTFNLPDLRGVFLRGLDNGRGLDSGRALGSFQADENKSHTHGNAIEANYAAATGSISTPTGLTGRAGSAITASTNVLTQPSGGVESRPKNVAVNYGIRWKATSEAIITPTDTFSTDTASLSYAGSAAYTLSTLQNAPVGTFITFTYAANTNTRTQTTTAPTQTTADMNTNGILLYSRAYNAASTAANPVAIAIQIGKGLKGVSQNLYKAVGKVTAGNLDHFIFGNFSSGARLKEYNEITGILVVDAGFVNPFVTSGAIFSFSDVSEATSGYLVINASKSPALTGVPLLQPRIATLKDVKASGTSSQTLTGAVWNTRQLTTLDDPSGIGITLASNQFILPAGQYMINARAAHNDTFLTSSNLTRFKVRLQNITDSSTVIVGMSNPEDTASASVGLVANDLLDGVITVTSSKTFELQHYAAQSQSAGAPCGIAGIDEVYAYIQIQKIK